MAVDPYVTAIIPAAGKGQRMGGQQKQFRLLGNRPLFIQTLHVFDAHPHIRTMVVAAPPEAHGSIQEYTRQANFSTPIRITTGGASRQQSVENALKLAPAATDVILVHDAVRPFIRLKDLSRIIEAILRYGAAALAIPEVDTLRRVTGDVFQDTVDRKGLYRMQTPQGALPDQLKQAFTWAQSHQYLATDEVALLQQAGFTVHYIPGTPYNIKITTPEDWEFASNFWPCWEKIRDLAP